MSWWWSWWVALEGGIGGNTCIHVWNVQGIKVIIENKRKKQHTFFFLLWYFLRVSLGRSRKCVAWQQRAQNG